ncbi:MAG: type II secretion system protein J [Phycisphaerae bacterium]
MKRIATQQTAERSRRGLTLIEMLVGVAVLAMLILAFSMILSTSQNVVSVSQSNMRNNSKALALAQVLRADLRQVTQNGFLCIAQKGKDGPPFLIFTQAGLTESLTAAESGSGAVVTLGMCDRGNYEVEDEEAVKVLLRQGWVLKAPEVGDKEGDTEGDVWLHDLSFFLALPRDANSGGETIQTYVKSAMNFAPSEVDVPIDSMDGLNEIWQVLAENCVELSIHWTDGSTSSNGLNWYGVEYRRDGKKWKPDVKESEGDIEEDKSPYLALWTKENQSLWPEAIRIRFAPKDTAGSAQDVGDARTDYEVVCTIGK